MSAFTSADIPRILALEPDLVLTFSDLQAEIAAELLKNGVAVMGYNHRTVAGILAMIRSLGALTGAADPAEALARRLDAKIASLAAEADGKPRPRVYFEEWDDPMISGIGWVSELIGIAGGQDVFEGLSKAHGAQDRIVTSDAVIAARPELILASWCGKKARPERIAARPGWDTIPAVAHGRITEIKSPLILQPGPAALTDGLDAIAAAIAEAR